MPWLQARAWPVPAYFLSHCRRIETRGPTVRLSNNGPASHGLRWGQRKCSRSSGSPSIVARRLYFFGPHGEKAMTAHADTPAGISKDAEVVAVAELNL